MLVGVSTLAGKPIGVLARQSTRQTVELVLTVDVLNFLDKVQTQLEEITSLETDLRGCNSRGVAAAVAALARAVCLLTRVVVDFRTLLFQACLHQYIELLLLARIV